MERRDPMLAKRILDIVVSAVLIIPTAPLIALVGLLVKIDSRGPAIFKQKRIGRDRRRAYNGGGMSPFTETRKRDLGGKPFTMYKFRSMVQEAEEILPSLVNLGTLREPVYKFRNDPRVTRFGKFLRRTSIDELPQFFNVLKGDMSLVGPRPEAQRIVFLYNENHRRRLQVKPGLTGWQQVHCRGSKSMSERLKYDLEYIERRSLLLDLWILLKTIFIVIRCKGAY
jgi:lipopolysaccharide/colanic/teichoic acid biosynthesis glycosyltransferase